MSLLLFADPRVTLRVPEDDKEEREKRVPEDKPHGGLRKVDLHQLTQVAPFAPQRGLLDQI